MSGYHQFLQHHHTNTSAIFPFCQLYLNRINHSATYVAEIYMYMHTVATMQNKGGRSKYIQDNKKNNVLKFPHCLNIEKLIIFTSL